MYSVKRQQTFADRVYALHQTGGSCHWSQIQLSRWILSYWLQEPFRRFHAVWGTKQPGLGKFQVFNKGSLSRDIYNLWWGMSCLDRVWWWIKHSPCSCFSSCTAWFAQHKEVLTLGHSLELSHCLLSWKTMLVFVVKSTFSWLLLV